MRRYGSLININPSAGIMIGASQENDYDSEKKE